ncbi:MAG: LysM domain-containing protein [Nocardioides alkalitolerans]
MTVVALLASLLLVSAVALALPGVAPVVDPLLSGSGTPATYDALLVALASTALLVAAPWCWVLVVLVCIDALRGAERRRRGCPVVLRRGVLLALGVTTAVALAQPATAGTAPAADPSTTGETAVGTAGAVGALAGGRAASPTAELLDGLPLPDRPDGLVPAVGPATAADAGTGPGPGPAGDEDLPHHVVVTGDDLWSIAAAHLPPAADDTAALEATLALHRANADVIGPDPDLILPGQRLDLGALSRPSE